MLSLKQVNLEVERAYPGKLGSLTESLILIDFALTVKAAILIFISGRGSAISSAKQGK